MAHRRFVLRRDEDVNGNSGTGIVAEGTQYTNGMVTITWKTEHRGVEVWDTLHSPKQLHGHAGKTKVVWIDPPDPDDEEIIEEKDVDNTSET